MNETKITFTKQADQAITIKPRFYVSCCIYFILIAGIFSLVITVDNPVQLITVEPEVEVTQPVVYNRPDFANIDNVQEKKETFFNYLKPLVEAENKRILQKRAKLLLIKNKISVGLPFSQDDLLFLKSVGNEFKFTLTYPISQEELETLLRRVDIIPSSLVLAQAANESAWGTSRFAEQGNNFFGQWCYTKGCGIVPRLRSSDANHEVKSFSTVADSIRAYFLNINTYHSYRELRQIRQNLRKNKLPIDGVSLSEGLENYSSRGEEYVNELQSMIYSNKLFRLDQA